VKDVGFRIIQLAGKGYCCSQILMLLALEIQGRENQDLVRAMSGLCMGAANSGGICGIFTGASCVMALYGAKGADAEKEADKLPLMLAEMSEWFGQNTCRLYGGSSCADIIGEDRRRPDPDRCGRLLVETWRRILEILLENGFDPANPDRVF